MTERLALLTPVLEVTGSNSARGGIHDYMTLSTVLVDVKVISDNIVCSQLTRTAGPVCSIFTGGGWGGWGGGRFFLILAKRHVSYGS